MQGFVVGSLSGRCRLYSSSTLKYPIPILIFWGENHEIYMTLYLSSGESIQLEKEVRLRGRKKPPGKSISGIQVPKNKNYLFQSKKKSLNRKDLKFPFFLGTQFFPRNSEKIMITSSDGKLRIYDGVAEIINKCRGKIIP